MSLLSWRRLNFHSYLSAWLVGGVFALLLISGIAWRSLYLSFLDEQVRYYQSVEQLIDKSALVEQLVISARNRSILISQMLFSEQAKGGDIKALLESYEQEALTIMQVREKYAKVADTKEKVLLDKHAETAMLNRSQQDYVIELLKEGDLNEAIKEYSESMLPVQEAPLRLLDQLQAHVSELRFKNSQAFNENAVYLNKVVVFSTGFYLLVLSGLACFVLLKLVRLGRKQRELQARLNDRLLETTVAYEQADKELIRLAHFDTVTDLLNRRYFEKRLAELLDQSASLSLLFIDLDNFKWFNDTLGHAVGDELLRRFAELMRSVHSPIAHAPIGRLGGDEFAIMLTDARVEQEQEVVNFLLESIAQLDEHYGPAKALNASIGIARYPEHAQVGDLLMRFADMAMYQAKSLGKGRAIVFNSLLLQTMYDELDLEQALKQALQERQLQVFYQAQYRLADLQLSGAEALMRWQRFGQWVSPAVLIPLAEKTGHIHALGLQILEKVLADIQRWDARSEHVPKVAVNVSPVQMRLDNSHDELVGRIDASGVDSTRIEVEITENAFADSEVCFSFIQHLAQRQIRIALDDFGTGYSSLSQITKLNIDTLKIDQSFVSQLEHSEQIRVLVKTIIRMGHGLGLTLLAEGIETRAQYELLKEWGCDEGQGYLFARPVPADQFSFAPLELS